MGKFIRFDSIMKLSMIKRLPKFNLIYPETILKKKKKIYEGRKLESQWSSQWDFRLTNNPKLTQAKTHLIQLQKKIKKKEKEIKKIKRNKPIIVNENSLIGFHITFFGNEKSLTFIKIPRLFNPIIPVPVLSSQLPSRQNEKNRSKTGAEEHRFIKFQKILPFLFLSVWFLDWYETKKICQQEEKNFQSP